MHNLHVDGVRRPQLHTVEFDDDTPKVAVAATQGDRLAVMDLQSALALLPADQKRSFVAGRAGRYELRRCRNDAGHPHRHRDVAPVARARAAAHAAGRNRGRTNRSGTIKNCQMSVYP